MTSAATKTTAILFLLFLLVFPKFSPWISAVNTGDESLPASKSFLGVDALHDFNYLFSYFHLLPYEGFISGLTRLIAYLIMFYATGAMLRIAFVSVKKS